jgi:large subunit ribosomal protein L35
MKLKTKKSAAKRFKLTGSGRIKRRQAYASHILTKKSSKRKRNLARWTAVSAADTKRVKQMLKI